MQRKNAIGAEKLNYDGLNNAISLIILQGISAVILGLVFT